MVFTVSVFLVGTVFYGTSLVPAFRQSGIWNLWIEPRETKRPIWWRRCRSNWASKLAFSSLFRTPWKKGMTARGTFSCLPFLRFYIRVCSYFRVLKKFLVFSARFCICIHTTHLSEMCLFHRYILSKKISSVLLKDFRTEEFSFRSEEIAMRR